jgi:hypothetical protein
MAKHRSLDHALGLAPELEEFIQRGRPLANDEKELLATKSHAGTPTLNLIHEVPTDIAPTDVTPDSQPESLRPVRESDSNPAPPALVPLTTRLQPDTAEALRRVHLENKLKRIQPDSQQAIVEHALREWLMRNGFL